MKRVTRAAAAAMQSQHDEHMAGQDSSIVNPSPSAVLNGKRTPINSRKLSLDDTFATNGHHETPQSAENVNPVQTPLSALQESTNLANASVASPPSVRKATLSSTESPLANGHATPNGTSGMHIDTEMDRPTPGTPSSFKRSVRTESTSQKALLQPNKSPANQVKAQARQGVRSTSNKENMQPGATTIESSSQPLDGSPATLSADTAVQTAQATKPDVAPIQTTRDSSFPNADMVEVIITPLQEAAPATAADTHPAVGPAKPSSRPATRPSTSGTLRASKTDQPRLPADISRPRPTSMSFPAPEPQPKARRPPTKSTFQLPGEAVAAKLRAAKEARQKKHDEEDAKKYVFKARPAPKMRASMGMVRQTAASRARESLMLGKSTHSIDENNESVGTLRQTTSVPKSLVRPRSSVSGPVISARPSTNATRRESTAARPSERPTTSYRMSTSAIDQNRANTSRPRITSNELRRSTMSTSKSANADGDNPTTTGTRRGKAVFARAAQAKELEDKKKREKEQLARKAREDAAERSRLASREWAAARKKKLAVGSSGLKNVVGVDDASGQA